jgi:acyl carrier protein
MSDELENRVREMITKRLRLKMPPDKLNMDQELFGGDLGLDSIDALELVVGMEKEFGVAVPDQQTGQRALRTPRTVMEYIREKKPDLK